MRTEHPGSVFATDDEPVRVLPPEADAAREAQAALVRALEAAKESMFISGFLPGPASRQVNMTAWVSIALPGGWQLSIYADKLVAFSPDFTQHTVVVLA